MTEATQALNEMLVGTDDLKAAVLGKEGDAGQVIQHPVKLALRSQGTQEAVAELIGAGHRSRP